jgi:hypothetical protein
MAVFQNGMGLTIVDPRSVDERYAAATTDAERQAIVAERDAANASTADANDAWHKEHGTGKYATTGGGSSSVETWDQARLRESRSNTIASLRAVMDSYGLTDLMNQITTWVQEGADEGAVMARIRDTDSYKQRFPAMATLSSKNRAISEAAYIEFERNAAQLERSYGLPAGMLGKDAVTNLIGNEVSARELEERVTMAAAGAFQTSQEVKDTFKNYYGIDSGGLTAYFLDPTRAQPLLNKQYAAAQIGAEAAMAGIGAEAQFAEDAVMAGVSREQARQGFGKAAGQKGLTQGTGDTVTEAQLAKSNLGLGSAQDAADIQRAVGGRLGQFQGGGEFLQTQKGNVGLGSAATR